MTTAHLRLEGTLTYTDYWCDYWGEYGQTTSFDYFRQQYEWESGYTGTAATDVRVTIHSQGGLCDIGYQCYDFLTTLGLPVTTVIQGDCMSAATIVFLAGSTRLIPRHGSMMIHLPAGSATGDVRVFEAYTAEMIAETQKLIDFYVRVTGQPEAVIAELLAASTILSAEKAVELGFATGILEPVSARAFVPGQVATKKINAAPPAPPSNASTSFHTNQHPRMSTKRNVIQTLIGAIINLATGVATTTLALLLADGRTLTVYAAGSAEALGDTVEIDGTAAADGDYTLDNGTVITVAGGIITTIVVAITDSGSETPASDNGATSVVVAQLQAELATVRAERDKATATMSQISNRMTHLEGLMGKQESAPVPAPVGSGATPSQKINRGGVADDVSLDDHMKAVAERYAKPKKQA